MDNKETTEKRLDFMAILRVVWSLVLGLGLALFWLGTLIVTAPFFIFTWLKTWIVSGIMLWIFWLFVGVIGLSELGFNDLIPQALSETAIYIVAGLSGVMSFISTVVQYRSYGD